MEYSEKDDEFFDKIEVFSSEDDRLKFLGELLSNESSRRILLLLTEHEMSANELSEKTDLRLSLVIHHLNKMQQVGIVKVHKIEKNTKNHDVKYYSAKSGIMIFPKEISEKVRKSKSLSASLTKIMRFSAIGIAGLASWAIIEYTENVNNEWTSGEEIPINISNDLSMSLVIGLSVVIVGLVSERIITFLRK